MDASKQGRDLAVIDDGTGVYLWSGAEPPPTAREWVWKALYRCEQCGRAVTILRFERDAAAEQTMRRLRTCPGGCASIRERVGAPDPANPSHSAPPAPPAPPRS